MNFPGFVTCVGCLILGNGVCAQPFQNLLADHSLSQWQKPNGDSVESGWVIEDGGVLHLSGKGGNIFTREVFGDFELWFEFRVADKGNNGIKYRVQQYEKQWLGLEYQILDDAAYPGLTRDHLTGSLYARRPRFRHVILSRPCVRNFPTHRVTTGPPVPKLSADVFAASAGSTNTAKASGNTFTESTEFVVSVVGGYNEWVHNRG